MTDSVKAQKEGEGNGEGDEQHAHMLKPGEGSVSAEAIRDFAHFYGSSIAPKGNFAVFTSKFSRVFLSQQ